jgi:hypothetical protein
MKFLFNPFLAELALAFLIFIFSASLRILSVRLRPPYLKRPPVLAIRRKALQK